ncbi:hypothetical protein L1887_43976 [Cichorium endivia]|nr:hypothetical protein L1887_43976 [Cichorium endivia]
MVEKGSSVDPLAAYAHAANGRSADQNIADLAARDQGDTPKSDPGAKRRGKSTTSFSDRADFCATRLAIGWRTCGSEHGDPCIRFACWARIQRRLADQGDRGGIARALPPLQPKRGQEPSPGRCLLSAERHSWLLR